MASQILRCVNLLLLANYKYKNSSTNLLVNLDCTQRKENLLFCFFLKKKTFMFTMYTKIIELTHNFHFKKEYARKP